MPLNVTIHIFSFRNITAVLYQVLSRTLLHVLILWNVFSLTILKCYKFWILNNMFQGFLNNKYEPRLLLITTCIMTNTELQFWFPSCSPRLEWIDTYLIKQLLWGYLVWSTPRHLDQKGTTYDLCRYLWSNGGLKLGLVLYSQNSRLSEVFVDISSISLPSSITAIKIL